MPRIDRISALHDDLLVNILSQVPTKDAVTTMVLSKRWALVWTMVPKLEYEDTSKEGGKNLWRLVDKSLQLHKAPVLESMHIQAERQFTDDADVGKCVSYAVDHNVREISLIIPSFILPSQPKILLLPSNFYTSKTLVNLTLSCSALVVDVPSLACFPFLQTLALLNVVFNDESSHARLLANCPALSYLHVIRYYSDNVTRFIVKVPSLKSFTYTDNHERYSAMPLVLYSPGLQHLSIFDYGDLGSIQNMPHLETAYVGHLVPQPNDKFLRSFSSVGSLHLRLMDVECFSAINFPRLMKFKLHLFKPSFSELRPGYSEYCSLEPLMLFLHNSPILKVLTISYGVGLYYEDLPLSWNQQSSVPGCLLAHLEIFVWDKFGGRRRQERECVEYILANSKCLKTATVLPRCYYSLEEKEKMVGDIKSLYRVSTSSQLITHSDSTNPGRATT
ncbi:unnamed protein product [Brassica oleracea var. botrytis]|uniref:(rape) hypothetical protein n=1 Tax=Brassica napus TaxID=3708 RepID=A0A816LDU2_BRANA|nr:unnamed protein product [Brassica napus]